MTVQGCPFSPCRFNNGYNGDVTSSVAQGCPSRPCRFNQDYTEVGSAGNKLSDPRVGSSHVLPPHVNGFTDADAQGCHLSPCRLLNIGDGAVDLEKVDESEMQHGSITSSAQGCPFSPCRFNNGYNQDVSTADQGCPFSPCRFNQGYTEVGSVSSIVPLGVRRLPTPPGREYSLKRVVQAVCTPTLGAGVYTTSPLRQRLTERKHLVTRLCMSFKLVGEKTRLKQWWPLKNRLAELRLATPTIGFGGAKHSQ